MRQAPREGPVPLAGGGKGARSVTMRGEELAMLVNGLDFKQTQAGNWYRRPA